MEEDYDEEAYDEEYDEEEEGGEAVDYGDDSIKEVLDIKKVKKTVTYYVSWMSYEEKTWETRETILEYGGAQPLKQFEAAREKKRIENEQKHKDQLAHRAFEIEKQKTEAARLAVLERARRAQQAANVAVPGPVVVEQEIQEPSHWPDLRDQLRTEPAPPSYDLTPLAEITVDTTNEPLMATEQPPKGRVRTLRTLAVNAFSKAVLLYEELGEFPSSLKAPVFALLMKSQELSVDHLKVLLSNDQKKLDFSVSPHIITAEHIQAVTERCRELEHLDLHHCRNAIGDSGIIAFKSNLMASIAAGCPNLTFLDLSYVQLVHNICDITLSCRHLRVLRAAHCELHANGLVSALDLKQLHLEELDVSHNPNLHPLQPLSRLFPGNCPNLKVLKISAIGFDEHDLAGVFRARLTQAKAAAEERSYTSAGDSALTKPSLRELSMNIAISHHSEPWLTKVELLQDIFSCLRSPASLETFDFGIEEITLYFSHPKVANVFRQFLMHAAAWLPGLKTLRMPGVRFSADQLVPEIWPLPITLPVTLTHLDWQKTSFPFRMVKHILFPEKYARDLELPIPRLRYLNLNDYENRMSYDPIVFVELMRNTYHPFEQLYLMCIGCSSYETGWDSRFSKDVLATIGFDEIRLAPQPLLTVLDLSRVRWLSINMLQRIVNVNVLPNLKELSIALGWNLQHEKLGDILTSAELPPMLSKLTITDKKVNTMVLFPVPDFVITSIKHLVINNCFQFADGIVNLLIVFSKLERLELIGRIGTDGNVWRSIESRVPNLKDLGIFCTPVPAYRKFFGSLKNSNVRTINISGCVDRGLKEQENKERVRLQMLVTRGLMTRDEMEDELYIGGKHKVRVNVHGCPCDKSTPLFPSYFV